MKYCENCVFVGKLSHSYVLFVFLAGVVDQGPNSRTKIHRKLSPFYEFQAKYLCLELETSGLSRGT